MPEQPTGSQTTRLEIVRAEDTHAYLLAEFFRHVWDSSATPESILASRQAGAALNVAEPGTPPPTWIALRSGKCIGFVTTIPIQLWDGTQDWPAYWIKGLMVLPEFRGGPIGYLILKAAVTNLPRTGALAVAPPARRLFEALGYKDFGAVPNLVRPLVPERILQRVNPAELGISTIHRWAAPALRMAKSTRLGTLAGRATGIAFRRSAAVRRMSALKFDAGPFDSTPERSELDQVWQDAGREYHSAVSRNARYLQQRYPSGPESPYVWLAARQHGTLAGVAILRRPREEGDGRLKGIRVATLADVLYPPEQPAVGLALLGAIERSARDFGADAILASTSAPAFRKLLRRQWYFPLAGNVHLLFRDVDQSGPHFGAVLADWWISRGDGQADDSF